MERLGSTVHSLAEPLSNLFVPMLELWFLAGGFVPQTVPGWGLLTHMIQDFEFIMLMLHD